LPGRYDATAQPLLDLVRCGSCHGPVRADVDSRLCLRRPHFQLSVQRHIIWVQGHPDFSAVPRCGRVLGVVGDLQLRALEARLYNGYTQIFKGFKCSAVHRRGGPRRASPRPAATRHGCQDQTRKDCGDAPLVRSWTRHCLGNSNQPLRLSGVAQAGECVCQRVSTLRVALPPRLDSAFTEVTCWAGPGLADRDQLPKELIGTVPSLVMARPGETS
jgi:hypothetical protein